jgi:hypothetical protein
MKKRSSMDKAFLVLDWLWESLEG